VEGEFFGRQEGTARFQKGGRGSDKQFRGLQIPSSGKKTSGVKDSRFRRKNPVVRERSVIPKTGQGMRGVGPETPEGGGREERRARRSADVSASSRENDAVAADTVSKKKNPGDGRPHREESGYRIVWDPKFHHAACAKNSATNAPPRIRRRQRLGSTCQKARLTRQNGSELARAGGRIRPIKWGG